MSPTTLLRRLERVAHRFDAESALQKRDLLERLRRTRLQGARAVMRLHEAASFIRAYPDDADVLAATERLFERFERRGDLRAHRDGLIDTGIVGTKIYYRFYFKTALWLARKIPDRLHLDWPEFENEDEFVDLLNLFVPYAETLAVDNVGLDAREWIRALKGPDETDAAFLMRRVDAMRMDVHGKEATFEGIDVPFVIEPGPGTPNRTRARWTPSKVVFQQQPLDGGRPDLFRAVRRKPKAVRALTTGQGKKMIELTREAMVTRDRDLYAFLHADPRDVRVVDSGDGLEFACLGMIPERRLVLESVYGFLTLKNGVPIGYVLASSAMGSSEVAFNIFDTFRGGEAGVVFAKTLAMIRHLFEPDTFSIDPYQLGHDNPEGLASGAWWFYYKMGFRPHDAATERLAARELARIQRNRKHRSSIETLNELSAAYMFLHLGKRRADVMGSFRIDRVGLAVSKYLAKRFGADRERGLEVCSAEAAELLGVRSRRGFSAGERLLWRRWSPLVMALPGVSRWTAKQRRDLADVVRAKGGRRESDYLRLFNRHAKLRAALARLAKR